MKIKNVSIPNDVVIDGQFVWPLYQHKVKISLGERGEIVAHSGDGQRLHINWLIPDDMPAVTLDLNGQVLLEKRILPINLGEYVDRVTDLIAALPLLWQKARKMRLDQNAVAQVISCMLGQQDKGIILSEVDRHCLDIGSIFQLHEELKKFKVIKINPPIPEGGFKNWLEVMPFLNEYWDSNDGINAIKSKGKEEKEKKEKKEEILNTLYFANLEKRFADEQL